MFSSILSSIGYVKNCFEQHDFVLFYQSTLKIEHLNVLFLTSLNSNV